MTKNRVGEIKLTTNYILLVTYSPTMRQPKLVRRWSRTENKGRDLASAKSYAKSVGIELL